MKKKILSVLLLIFVCAGIFACGGNKQTAKKSLGGVEYDSDFVTSGYYFDKASLSEIQMQALLSNVQVIEKPKNLGTIELPDFSKIELKTVEDKEITPEDIEAEIERLRDIYTVYIPVKTKRNAELNDKVIIDFKGFLNGKEFEGGASEKYELVLGSGAFIPGFEEQIVGHKAGSKFSIDVVFPEEYGATDLAGKPVTFDINIHSIEELSIPEINDEFVKNHTTKGSNTLDEYREEIKSRLTKRNEFFKNNDLMFQLFNKLVDEAKIEPTEEALAWKFSTILSQLKMQAAQYQMGINDLLLQYGSSAEDALVNLKSNVPSFIAEDMIIDALAKKYNINVNEKDAKEWYSEVSDAMGYGQENSYEQYIAQMGEEMALLTVKQYKATVKAVENCQIVYEEPTE